jgi:SAM-dependent methyltransferase
MVSTEGSSDGWAESAQAWIAEIGEHGDWSRRYVLDAVMLERALVGAPANALDVGCGEGRFCRLLSARGVRTVGVDPTLALIARARALDPTGDYRIGAGEALPAEDASFDMVVSYLTLIDIPDYRTAIGEMARVLRPGGSLLVANLTSFVTARVQTPEPEIEGERHFEIDHYLEERANLESWRGINILNWHRPLSAYMKSFLDRGLVLSFFDEPEPVGGDPETTARYRRIPWFMVMHWIKPDPSTRV